MSSSSRFIKSSTFIMRVKIYALRMCLFFFVAVLGTGVTFATVTVASAALLASPSISATKTDAFIGGDGDGKADPGETIEYTVTIPNGAAPGVGNDATGVTFNDVIDAHTTLVGSSLNVSPLAINDSYDTIGNTLLEVGVAAGADPAVHVSATLFDNDVEFLTDAGTFNITSHTSPANGTLVAFNNGTGTFSYLPNPSFTGTDTFTYTLTDSGGLTDTATVTINVTNRVWYVKNNATAGGLGRSTDPFDTLVEAQTASLANDTIYVFTGSGTTTGQNAGITLKNGQRLLGEGVALTVPVSVNGGSNPTTLRSAGSQPQIDNTGGNGVTVTDISGVEIHGLNIAGSTNAVSVSTTATSGGFDLSSNTIRSAGANGVDVNGGGSGTLSVSLHDNTITATGNAIDMLRSAGNIAITAFDDNVVSGNTAGAGINIVGPSVTFDATPGGSFNTVSGGTTVIGSSGNGVGTSGIVLTNVAGDLSFTDLDIENSSGAGLRASGTTPYTGSAGFQIAVGAGVSNIVTNGGPAVDLNTVKANNLPFVSITSTNSPTTGVALNSLLGSFSAAGSISGVTSSSGTSFQVGSSNATVSYTGTITATTGKGVELTNNTGSTISFTGLLTLSSGTNSAFTATGGGTVTSTNVSSTLTSTTGTALNVANTTIGASGLTFTSISANGASKGIILNTTGSSGALSVTGSGTTDGSGGTIQNISTRGGEFISTSNLSLKNMNFTNANTSDTGGTCDDLSTSACNAAIYLSSVSTVTLDNINVTGTTTQEGINGISVSNFTLSNSTLANCGGEVEEGCIKMRELTGTSAISSSSLTFPGADVVEIVNTTGSLLLNVNSSTFSDSQASASGNTGIQLRNQGTASGIINVNNSTFLRIRTVGLNVQAINTGSSDVDVTGSTFDPDTGTMIGMDLSADNSATLKFNIQNNTKIYSRNGPAVNVFGDTSAVINGRINNNSDVQVKSNVGSNVGSGIRVNINKDATAKLEVKNNVVNVGSDDAGIDLSGIGKTTANPGGATNTLDATVTGNNVTIGATSTYGVVIIAASNGGDTNAVCSNVASNAITRNPSSIASFRARVASANGFFRMNGFSTDAGVTWNNNGNTPINDSTFGGSGTFGSCTAALPTNPALSPSTFLPDSNHVVAQNQVETIPMVLAQAAANANSHVSKSFSKASAAVKLSSKQALGTSTAALLTGSQDGGLLHLVSAQQPAPARSGETVNVSIGTLPAGKTVTIKFRVTVDALGAGEVRTRILNQGAVSGTNFSAINTTDPSPSSDAACLAAPSIGTKTCTPVDRPDTTVTSIARDDSNPTNASSVSWTVTFGTGISGLTSSNLSLVNVGLGGTPAITGVTAIGGAPATQWTVTASTGSGDGTLELRMANDTGLSHDVTNQPYTQPSSGAVYTIDRTVPTVTINQAVGQADPTNTSPIHFTVVFSESVTGFATGDVSLSGTAGATTDTVTGSGTTYDVAVSGMTGDGTVIATVAASVAQDAAGNNNTASTSTDNRVTYDTTAPTVTINQAVGQSDPTNASPINFTVVFSESVTGFATGDVTLSGGAGATTGTVTGSGTTYNVAVTGMTGDGTVIASILAGVAQDAAGNNNTASTSTDHTVTYDATPPTVTINQAVGQADPTNASPINFTVVFSEPVTGFATGDVSFTGSTVGGSLTGTVSGGPTTYTVAVTGMTGAGTVLASIPASVAQDGAGNNNSASTSTDDTVSYDGVAPTVTINQGSGQSDPTGTSPIIFDVVFSESVTSFATGDVSFTGSTAGGTLVGTVSGSGTTYTVSVSGMTSDGTVVASIPAGVAQDGAANTNAASTSTDNTVTYDTVPPDVTINQAVGQSDPTNGSPINFTVVFSEAVTGFATGDVSFTGSTVGGSLTGTVSGGPTTYNVAVTGMTGSGTVVASIPASVAADLTAKPNNASTSTDNTVTYDGIAPTVTINQASGQVDPTNASPINFTVVFSEAVTGFATGDVSFTGSTVGGTLVGTVSGSGTTYNVAVTGMTGSGTVVASLAASVAQDAAGNNNSASTSTDNTVSYDGVAPTVTINQGSGQSDPTGTSPIIFDVVFSEAVTGFATGDVSFTGSTAPGTLVGTVSGSGTTYTVSVSGMTGDGTVVASIAAGVAQDLAGNNNTASTSTDNTVSYDITPPSVTINQAVGQADPTNASPINFTVVFSEPVTGFATGDVSFTGSTVGGSLTGTVSGGPTTYTVAVTGMTGSGTVVASVPASVAADLSSKPNNASTSTDNTVTFDNVAPTVTINQKTSAPAQADPTSASPIHFTAVFSEAVTGFATGDVTLGGTAGATTASITEVAPNNGTTYDVAVSGMTGGGTVTASINAAVATDLAGNANAASTSTDNTVTFTIATTTTITSDTPDPSIVGQAVTVNFTVVAAVGANPSVGNVTVTDSGGATPCVGAVTAGAGTCNITLTTSGAHTLTATYAGSGSFNGSSDTESHSVSVTITVNTFADDLTNNGNCSLREAIRAANTNAAVDTCPAGSASVVDNITLATGTYTISRVGTDDTAILGDLDITGDTKITGTGAANTFIAGASLDRVFQIISGTVQMDNLTIKNGLNAIGGGIYNAGTLTLNSVTVTSNSSVTGISGTSSGAGIYNTGTLTLNNATVSNNTATSGVSGFSRGGGIHNNGGTVTLNSTTVTGNKAISGALGTSQGGGIYTTGGSTTLNSTTPSGNTVLAGAGGSSAGPNTYP